MKINFELSEPLQRRLDEFGYTPEKLPLLFLMPFVQVAWAEGFLQPVERRAILRLATTLKVTPRHPVYEDLHDLLETEPSEAFCAEANHVLREFLETIPPAQSESLRTILQIGCFRVAQAAGDIGFFKNRSRITPEEREKIYSLGETLQFSLADYLD